MLLDLYLNQFKKPNECNKNEILFKDYLWRLILFKKSNKPVWISMQHLQLKQAIVLWTDS